MPLESTSRLQNDLAPFSRLSALVSAAITAPAILFAADPTPSAGAIGISVDAERQTVTITVPQDSGFTAIQAQTVRGGLSGTNWFNIPGGILSTNQGTLEVQAKQLPPEGCFFRGVTDRLTSDVRISKEPHGADYHIVVTVDDKVLRNPDGSINPAELNHWTIQNSTDGVRWSSSGYQVTPGGTQFALRVPALNGAEPFFVSRIQYQP